MIRRLNRLEKNAHETMNQAQALIGIAKTVVEELKDGFEIAVTILGKEMPIKVKFKFKEDTDE